MKGRN